MSDDKWEESFTAKNISYALDEAQRVGKLTKEERERYDDLLEESVKTKQHEAMRKKYFAPINYFFCVLGVVISPVFVAVMNGYFDVAILKADDPISVMSWLVVLPTVMLIVALGLKNSSPRYLWFIEGIIFGIFAKLV